MDVISFVVNLFKNPILKSQRVEIFLSLIKNIVGQKFLAGSSWNATRIAEKLR
jgi:hypothetical protein